MSTAEERLRNWQSNDSDYEDDLHCYFADIEETTLKGADWCDVAEEGRKLWNIMFGDVVEENSPIDAFISAIAAAGAHTVFSALERAMGLPKDTAEAVLDSYYEGVGSEYGPPISCDEMRRIADEHAQFLVDLKARKFSNILEEPSNSDKAS